MFLKLLLEETPRKGLKVRVPELFYLVEKNFNEITSALEQGYSWEQVERLRVGMEKLLEQFVHSAVLRADKEGT